MAFNLPSLPYDKKALEPYISSQTLDFHHGKHHQAYVTNLNTLIEGTSFQENSLEEIIIESKKDSSKAAVFNNAAQIWNHTFFWHCMKPNGGGAPTGALAELIRESFDSLESFKEQFKQAAVTQFGSGWAWLVQDKGGLQIVKTSNAELPMTMGQNALLTCDVWEHAYYLDYQNRRPDFVQTFLDHLINWDFVASNLTNFL